MSDRRALDGEEMLDSGLDLVVARPLVRPVTSAWIELLPGDRPLVESGDTVASGAPLVERLHERWTEPVRVGGRVAGELRPGAWWPPVGTAGTVGPDGQGPSRRTRHEGEILFAVGDRLRIATGDRRDTLASPVGGVVAEVRPGTGIRISLDAVAFPAAELVGSPVRGGLEVLAPAAGEVRAGSIDVALAGRIVVAGARIDVEALSRARATGVAGIVVASLGSRERRDVTASEVRQRAALRPPPPFGILVLEGAARRPIPGPVFAALQGLAGRTVALLGSPPCLVVDASQGPEGRPDMSPAGLVDAPRPGHVRVRSGALAGREGTWVGLAGPRTFEAGIVAEAAFVRFGPGAPVAVPLGSLERFV